MAQLSPKEKDRLVDEAILAIARTCKMHKLEMDQLPKPLVSLLVEIFQEGAKFAQTESKRYE